MSDLEDQYRNMADKARSDANAATLTNVRDVHLRSAERLDELASQIQSVARAKARNQAAKRNLTGA
jgi:hypothetical protein